MRCQARSSKVSRLLRAGSVALLTLLAVPATGHAAAPSCIVAPANTAATPQTPLRFGIYPGGPAGSVSAKAPPRPEDPAKRLTALKRLAGAKPFVVRLYSAWTGAGTDNSWLDREIAGYTASGLQVELVVRFKPAAPGASAPAGFADYVRSVVRRYGPDPRFVSLQVTNEANLPGAPEAADGAFAGAAQAVVRSVIAAKDQIRASGHPQVRVGFSWAYDERPQASTEFWATLGRLGGTAFAAAVDWVGLDTYPGTWAPQIALSNLMPGQAGGAIKESVRALRDCFMPLAGLGRSTALHIAENGFPTGPGRSPAMQAQVLAAMVRSVEAIRATNGITDYRWFDLRDSSSADPSIESQYGITRDDYSPKPAFAVYRDIIARPAAARVASRATNAGTCRPARVLVRLPRIKRSRPTSLVVRVGGKVVGKVNRSQIKRVVRISMRSGRSVVRLKLRARSHGRQVTRTQRRTVRVC